MSKKNKYKINTLNAPSLLRRVWKTGAYTAFWCAVFFPLFLCFYTLDDLAYELDVFSIYGLVRPKELLLISVTFFFFFRQLMKTINFVKFTYLSACHDEDTVKKGGYKRAIDGDEGTGKTLNNAYDTLLIGASKDKAMRLSYYLKYPYSSHLKNDVDFKVLKESFDYFQAHGENIPHVMSNFKIIYEGKKNYPWSKEYLDQTKRLAEGFACGITEMGNILPNAYSKIPKDDSKDEFKTRIKNETLSLSRQFFDLTMTADEQRTGEIFLGYRALVTFNRHLTARKKVCAPKFLQVIQKFYKKRIVALGDKVVSLDNKIKALNCKLYIVYKLKKRLTTLRSYTPPRFEHNFVFKTSKYLNKLKKKRKRLVKRLSKKSAFYNRLSVFIEDVGFYKFSYELRDPTTNALIADNLTFVMSCDIPFEFDTRGERFNYDLYSHAPE